MIDDNIEALVKYRLEQADESLQAAEALIKEGLLASAVNRAYYAMFYSVLALLALEKKETSKHSGAISLFDKDYVKTEMFPKELSKWLHEAFDLRQRSDYAARYVPSGEEVKQIIGKAASFVARVSEKLEKTIKELDR